MSNEKYPLAKSFVLGVGVGALIMAIIDLIITSFI